MGMRTAQVRELKYKTSNWLVASSGHRRRRDYIPRPASGLFASSIQPNDITIRPRARSGNYADPAYRKEALRLLDAICKLKPDKGKQWVSQEEHDAVLYGDL